MGRIHLKDPDRDKLLQIFLKGVRSQALQKLIFLEFIRNSGSPDIFPSPVSGKTIYEIKPEDVADLLGCSKRTAYDYIKTLQVIKG
jgi:hypothetical protein